jgi:hypothetical protein
MMARGHKNAYTDLTAETVGELFEYSLHTGWLYYRKAPSNFKKRGDKAGTLTKHGYIRIVINGKHYYAHRLIWLFMTGKWPTHEIDHINGKPSDNRWANLRKATSSQNLHNREAPINNTSGFKGVWKASTNRWCAEIQCSGVKHRLGWYGTPERAAEAYKAAAIRLRGKFAKA